MRLGYLRLSLKFQYQLIFDDEIDTVAAIEGVIRLLDEPVGGEMGETSPTPDQKVL